MDKSESIQELIKEIEQKYPVESVLVNGVQFWPYYKIFFFNQIAFKKSTAYKQHYKKLLKQIVQPFFGCTKWFKRTDILSFSSTIERKKVNSEMFDKSLDAILQHFPDALHIELPLPTHYSRAEIPHKRTASELPLKVLEILIGKLNKSVSIEGFTILEQIQEDYNNFYPPLPLAQKFTAQIKIGNLLARWYKPKVALFVASYMRMGYVKGLKDAGVHIYEIQHGTINRSHYSYNHQKLFDAHLYPDQLFVFSDTERKVLSIDNLYSQHTGINILGHFYLNYIQKMPPQKELTDQLKSYRQTVAVSLQEDEVGDLLLPFIKKVSIALPDVGFVLVPRMRTTSFFAPYQFPKNVHFASDLNVYEIIHCCSIHCTAFSTCAIEAPSIGKPNLLVNLENKAVEYFGETLTNKKVHHFINTESEMIELLKKMEIPDKQYIQKSNDHLINSKYDHALLKLVEEIKSKL